MASTARTHLRSLRSFAFSFVGASHIASDSNTNGRDWRSKEQRKKRKGAQKTQMVFKRSPWRLRGPSFAAALLALALSALPAFAVEPNEQLKNPALEARARAISTGLRCLVCQNETIDESNASLAHDIRVLLRERLTAGDTDAQAVKAIVDRYGEFVLLNPPVEPATYVLWFGPVGVLLIGLIGGAIWLRRRDTTAGSAAPLNADEQSRLESILREADR